MTIVSYDSGHEVVVIYIRVPVRLASQHTIGDFALHLDPRTGEVLKHGAMDGSERVALQCRILTGVAHGRYRQCEVWELPAPCRETISSVTLLFLNGEDVTGEVNSLSLMPDDEDALPAFDIPVLYVK